MTEQMLSPGEQSKGRNCTVPPHCPAALSGGPVRPRLWTAAATVHRVRRSGFDCASVMGVSEDDGVQISGYPLTGIIRQVRRRADFSQRELAKFAHLSPAAVGAIESGRLTPSLPTLQRLLNAANCQLVVVDADGRLVVPLMVWRDTTDGAGRRYPAHLDTILDPEFGEWWADGFGLARPPETFRRNRKYRDWQRARSRREVRNHGSTYVRSYRPPRMDPGDEWKPDPGSSA